MRVRRCTTLWFESREVADFDLAALLAGGTGVAARLQWFAHAGHLDAPVAIDEEELRLLGSLASAQWTPAVPLRARHGALKEMVPRWLNEKAFNALVSGSGPAHRRHGGDGALYVYLRKKP